MIPNQKAFDDLLAWLNPDRNIAGQKYREIHYKLVKFFEWNGCYTPEECADKTIDTIAGKIEEGPLIRDAKGEIILKKGGYVFGVAKNVLRDWRRDQDKIRLEPWSDDIVPPSGDPTTQNCRKLCLEKLDDYHNDEWKLLCEYYQGSKISKRRRLKIAIKMGISLNALTIRISRIKDELWQEFQTCMKECLKRSNLF